MGRTGVTNLRCEYQEQPLGLDTERPRFSWWMDDGRPGAAQTAYRIEVSTDAGFNQATMVWDSGDVVSSQSVLVPYDGPPPAARTRYWYRVRLRDHAEEWFDWSSPAWFETAMLDRTWQAEWIGPPDDGEAGGAPPYLRKEFDLSGTVAAARLYVAARGLAEISLNGIRVGDDVLSPGWTDFTRRAQYLTYDVTDLVSAGVNAIGVILGDGWYSGRIARVHDGPRCFGARPQLLCELHLSGTSGETTVVRSDGSWMWRTGPIIASDI